MKTIKVLSLAAVIASPVILSGCESLFAEENAPRRYYASESYYHYDGSGDSHGGGSSRSYGRGSGGGGSSKPPSDRPSTSSTADSIGESAEVPVEPPSLE